MSKNIGDILIQIKDRLDPDELVDRLGLTTEELCDVLVDYISDNLDKFEDIYNEEE